jgi:serine-type D-Ala-D-Ala carboxypeptidase (penicillin-binding protein 5/6)
VPYYAIQRYRYPGTPAANDSNRNLLLFRDPTVDGLKTGYTNAAGYCMVTTARREVRLGSVSVKASLLSVVLGAASENARAAESQKLLNWGYTAFEAVRLALRASPGHTQGLEGQGSPGRAGAAPGRGGDRCRPVRVLACRPRSCGPSPWWRRCSAGRAWAP